MPYYIIGQKLIDREKIPIMKAVFGTGMGYLEASCRTVSKESLRLFNSIYKRHTFSEWKKIMTPEEFYNYFKKELCGDPFANWQQALKQSNPLRLDQRNTLRLAQRSSLRLENLSR